MSIVTAKDRNDAATAINNARERWGLSKNVGSVNVGDSITATDINSALEALREAKNSSGWDGVISSNVTKGDYITNIFASIITAANNIQSHCGCFGNCTGTCTSSCTGGCSTTCTGGCAGSCNTTCDGTCWADCASSCGGCGPCPCNCGGCGAGGNKRISPISPYYMFKTDDILDIDYWRGLIDE